MKSFHRRLIDARLVCALIGTSLSILVIAIPSAGAEERPTIVVTEFFLQDDMVPGPGGRAPGAADVARRTRDLAAQVRAEVLAGSRFELVPLDTEGKAYRDYQASSGRIFECKSCVTDLGRALGTDYVLHGWVQRVSNLIINLNVEIIDTESGKIYDRASVDTRGNTDKSWRDGGSYLIRHLNHGL